MSYETHGPITWGCRIHWLKLCRGHKTPPPTRVLYMTSDGEAPHLEIWEMWSTPSLPWLPSPLWPGVVAPDRVLSMGQIEQTMHANKWLMLNSDCCIAIIWNHLTSCKKRAQARLRMLSTKFVYRSYLICINRIWL